MMSALPQNSEYWELICLIVQGLGFQERPTNIIDLLTFKGSFTSNVFYCCLATIILSISEARTGVQNSEENRFSIQLPGSLMTEVAWEINFPGHIKLGCRNYCALHLGKIAQATGKMSVSNDIY